VTTTPFVIADVFTERAFAGNQLAVLPDARGLSDRAMQLIAREFNFAETTFVLPPDDPGHARRVRIFTPGAELEFAGHPTLGTASVLAHLGLVPASGSLLLELGVGPVRVDLTAPDRDADPGARSRFARLTLERALDRAPGPDPGHAAAALSISRAEVLDAWFASVGVPFCCVHLASAAAVDRAVLDRTAWQAHFAGAWSALLYLFAGRLTSGGRLHARMFAPSLGVAEDPATGSAAATLVGALVERDAAPNARYELTIEQGAAMGRPSVIAASAEKSPAHPLRVMVGGSTVVVAQGTIAVPD
jgi:trans-2,3-dihydro-3-hydroxyanthranilate isomerase